MQIMEHGRNPRDGDSADGRDQRGGRLRFVTRLAIAALMLWALPGLARADSDGTLRVRNLRAVMLTIGIDEDSRTISIYDTQVPNCKETIAAQGRIDKKVEAGTYRLRWLSGAKVGVIRIDRQRRTELILQGDELTVARVERGGAILWAGVLSPAPPGTHAYARPAYTVTGPAVGAPTIQVTPNVGHPPLTVLPPSSRYARGYIQRRDYAGVIVYAPHPGMPPLEIASLVAGLPPIVIAAPEGARPHPHYAHDAEAGRDGTGHGRDRSRRTVVATAPRSGSRMLPIQASGRVQPLVTLVAARTDAPSGRVESATGSGYEKVTIYAPAAGYAPLTVRLRTAGAPVIQVQPVSSSARSVYRTAPRKVDDPSRGAVASAKSGVTFVYDRKDGWRSGSSSSTRTVVYRSDGYSVLQPRPGYSYGYVPYVYTPYPSSTGRGESYRRLYRSRGRSYRPRSYGYTPYGYAPWSTGSGSVVILKRSSGH